MQLGNLIFPESREKMSDLKQRLSDAIHNVGEDKLSEKINYCAMEYSKPCCQGNGYIVSKNGAFLSAKVCGCITACPNCMGAMFKVDSKGESRACKRPLPSVVTNLFNSAHIPARYLDAKLEGFSNFTGNGQGVAANVNKYIESFEEKNQMGLIISGSVGVGKTFLLASMAKDLIAKGYSVKFVDFFQLLAEIKASFSKKESEDTILKPLIDVDILFIDELGKGRSTEFEFTIIDQIVMGRYNQDKPIIATTNYLLKEHANQQNYNYDLTQSKDSNANNFSPDVYDTLKNRVGARVFSRLEESCHFTELTGEDFRKMKARSRGVSF